MIAGGGNTFTSSYLITVGVFAFLLFTLILWRIIFNFVNKAKSSKLKQSVCIISAFLMFIIFFTFFFMASSYNKVTNFKVVQVITLLLLIIQNFLPLIFFGIIFLLLHYWIGIYVDIFKISRGNLFTKYTRILFYCVSVPLVVLAILNVVSLKRVFFFRTRQRIDLAVFLLPTIIAAGLSSFLLIYSVYLIHQLYDKSFKKRMLYLIFRFIFVSLSILLSCVLNIANRYSFNFLLPFEFHLVFLIIICFEICFIIYFDFNFLYPREIKNQLIIVYCKLTGNEYFESAGTKTTQGGTGTTTTQGGSNDSQAGANNNEAINKELFSSPFSKRQNSLDVLGYQNGADRYHNTHRHSHRNSTHVNVEKNKSKLKIKPANSPTTSPRATIQLAPSEVIQMDEFTVKTDGGLSSSLDNDLHALDILNFNKAHGVIKDFSNDTSCDQFDFVPSITKLPLQQQHHHAIDVGKNNNNTNNIDNDDDYDDPSDTSDSDNSISVSNSLPNPESPISNNHQDVIVHSHLDDEL